MSELHKPEIVKVRGMRRTIARRMHESITATAQFTLHTTIEIPELVLFKQLSPGITYTDLFVKASSLALMQHPRLNATMLENTIQYWSTVNIGLAVALDDGLIVPVIPHVEQKTLEEIASIRKDLATRALLGELTAEEVNSGTFTITNLGRSPVEEFTPILNTPQVAILGIGKIEEAPRVVNGEIEILPIVHISLTLDHRAVDGDPGAAFLHEFESILKQPESMVEKVSSL